MRKAALLIGALLMIAGMIGARTDASAATAASVGKPKYCLETKAGVTKCKAVNYVCPKNKGCPAPTD